MKTFKILVLNIFVLFSGVSIAQNNLSGTVTNHRNKPVAKALIYLDSVNANVKTNRKGFYEVVVPQGVTFINVFSHRYGLLSFEYKGESKIDFVFIEGKKTSGERIDERERISLGYNEADKKYVAVKVASIEGEDTMDAGRFLTIYDMIRDRVPGVRVSGDNRITIRGVNSMISSQQPLFVVDGTIISSIDHIAPFDVKSISVLKGVEASIYGTRAANGVLLIKTKR